MKILAFFTLVMALGWLPVAEAQSTRYQTSNVVDLTGTLPFYTGAAWLVRTEDSVRGRIMTKVSTAGDPYTLWIVVFNDPSECTIACGFFDPIGDLIASGGAVYSGTGAISAADGGLKRNGKPAGGGVLNMDFEFSTGGLPNDLFVLFPPPPAETDGLDENNGFGAEIHLVVDKHPSIAPGASWLNDLTTTNGPGMGPATNEVFAVFVACPDASCPAGEL